MSLKIDTAVAWRAVFRDRATFVPLLLILAAGLGTATAIFTIADGVYWKALPFRDAEQVVVIWQTDPTQPYGSRRPVSAPNFRDWQASARSLADIAATSIPSAGVYVATGEPERVRVSGITTNALAFFGAAPTRGRGLLADTEMSVLISDQLWRSSLNGAEDVLGHAVEIDGRSYAIVGVLPPAFRLGLYEVDVIVPMAARLTQPESRSDRSLTVFGRLAAGVTIKVAQLELTAIADRLSHLYPDENRLSGAEVVSLHENAVGYLRPFFALLTVGAVLLLVIMGANATSLMLSHILKQQTDFAIRRSLGATEFRIARLVFLKALLASVLAGLAALAIAAGFVPVFLSYAPSQLPRIAEVGIDWRTIAFLGALVAASALGFGLVPRLRARYSLSGALREHDRAVTGSRREHLVRHATLAIEVALTLVLVVGSTLVAWSLLRVTATSPGFNANDLLTFRLMVPPDRQADAAREFHRRVFEQFDATPGLETSVGTTALPFTATSDLQRIATRDGLETASTQNASAASVTPGYFASMGIPLLAGRGFDQSDVSSAPRVAVVSATLAARLFAGSPLGQEIAVDTGRGDVSGRAVTATIVGVVGDIKQWNLLDAPDNQIYYAYAQRPLDSMYVAIRTQSPERALREARRVVAAVDRTVPVFQAAQMTDRIGDTIGNRRLNTVLLQLFAATAILLASFGLYAAMSNSVTRRQKELGVRRALGASSGSLYRLLFATFLKVTAAGIVMGIALTIVLARSLSAELLGSTPYRNYLHGVTDVDTIAAVVAVVSLGLIVIGLAAVYVPARRGALTDPMLTLRQ